MLEWYYQREKAIIIVQVKINNAAILHAHSTTAGQSINPDFD